MMAGKPSSNGSSKPFSNGLGALHHGFVVRHNAECSGHHHRTCTNDFADLATSKVCRTVSCLHSRARPHHGRSGCTGEGNCTRFPPSCHCHQVSPAWRGGYLANPVPQSRIPGSMHWISGAFSSCCFRRSRFASP